MSTENLSVPPADFLDPTLPAEAPDVEDITYRGAARAAVAPRDPEQPNRAPGLRHLVYILLSVVLLSLVPAFVAFAVVTSNSPELITDSEAFQKAVEDWLTTNGVGLILSFLVTGLSLLLPVFIAGRLARGGWRGLVQWKVRWKQDLLIAVGFVAVMRVLEAVLGLILKTFDVDASKLSNGDLLTSAGPDWVPVIGLLAMLCAPLAEELCFRGLMLNVLSARFGVIAGVLVSSIVFGLMHVQDSVASTIYTCGATGVVGLLLAILVTKTRRLGTSILAHAMYNGSAVALVLISQVYQ